jgi:hypothetical protein
MENSAKKYNPRKIWFFPNDKRHYLTHLNGCHVLFLSLQLELNRYASALEKDMSHEKDMRKFIKDRLLSQTEHCDVFYDFSDIRENPYIYSEGMKMFNYPKILHHVENGYDATNPATFSKTVHRILPPFV